MGTTAGASSFSHGFFLRGLAGSVPCPTKTVGGISLIPGTGFPLVINSTMWAKDVGYGAAGSLALVGAGSIPPPAVPLLLLAVAEGISKGGCMPFEAGGVGGGRPRALRYALYSSKSMLVLNFLVALLAMP